MDRCSDAIASRVVVKLLEKSKITALRESAAPLAGLVLSAGVVIGDRPEPADAEAEIEIERR